MSESVLRPQLHKLKVHVFVLCLMIIHVDARYHPQGRTVTYFMFQDKQLLLENNSCR